MFSADWTEMQPLARSYLPEKWILRRDQGGANSSDRRSLVSASPTFMARELAEIPDAARRLLSNRSLFAAVAARIRKAGPRIVVLCGRGSSGHVGVYLRYLFEAQLGMLVSTAAPSVVTAYRTRPDMRDAL